MKMHGPRTPEESTPEDAALRWLLEREEGFGPGRAEAFAAWRSADPRHEAAVVEVEEGMALLAEMPAVATDIERRIARREARSGVGAARPAAEPRFGLAGWRGWATAFAAAAAIMLVVALGWRERVEATPQRIVTDPLTVRRHVPLSDGSVVHVNTASDLQVELTLRERRINLHAGEAHFAVAPDGRRPFVVAVGGVQVRAIGTAFDVRRHGAEVQVIVHEGRVEVVDEAAARGAASASTLGAGEAVRVHGGRAQPVERLDPRALEAALAWHEPTVTFASLPLQEVVARFNRHGGVQLVIADAALAARPIGGTFSLRRPEALLHLLEQEGDVAVDRTSEPGRVTLRWK